MKSPRERELEILKFWEENKIFQKSLDKNDKKNIYRYYDGPPYATGEPHFGHVLPTSIKDLLPRYKTMRGYYVPRSWGWDTHGLPIENLAEKNLGFTGKKDIEEYGIEAFNQAAKDSVFLYRDVWKKIIPRLGRFVDMENDYRTLDSTFMESNIWAFKELWNKNLVYESYKIMPWCPHCETVLSNHETSEGYKDIADLSAYVRFYNKDLNASFIAWTTTPWTLPGNTALAINKDLIYLFIENDIVDKNTKENIIICKNSYDKILKLSQKNIENFRIIKEIKGEEFINLSYTAPFNYYQNLNNNTHKIYHGDFVTDTDGTGIVHIAPAFGEDDMNLAKIHDIDIIIHVDRNGKFKNDVLDFNGYVKPKDNHQMTDIEIIKYLAHNDKLFLKEKYNHNYAHCWRCNTPLINYPTSSWFIKTTVIKDKMIEENNKVSWYPDEIGHKRLDAWLNNVRDWAVSRSRFWGTPLPVWRAIDTEGNNHDICLGSLNDIKDKTRKNTYHFMRHGEAMHLVKNMMISDIELSKSYMLTEKGIEEVKTSFLKYLENDNNKIPDILYASPLGRTMQSAEIIQNIIFEKTSKKIDIVIDKRLKEIDFGDMNNHDIKTRDGYFQNYNDIYNKRYPGQNAESYADVRKRVAEFLYEIDEKYQNQNIFIIAHEGVLLCSELISKGLDEKNIIKFFEKRKSHNTAAILNIDFANIPHNHLYEADFHRPYIDNIEFTFNNLKYKRLTDVLDVWYDAGSMPFSSVHYPFEFENDEAKKEFINNFQVDFVSEGLDQTRGWFYHLLIMGVALFDKAPFKNVLVNGLVLAEDGKKMSKSLKNYDPVMNIVDEYGADAIRYFLLSSPIVHAEETALSKKILAEINNKLFNKLSNTMSFIDMYNLNNNSEIKFTISNQIDAWIYALLEDMIVKITKYLDEYDIDKAARLITPFIEELSTWYLRVNRDRFKDNDINVSNIINSNLLYLLGEIAKILAPFSPFFAEYIWQYLRGKNDTLVESVHLSDWPKINNRLDFDHSNMTNTRIIIENGLALRNKHNIKVRQPLKDIYIPDDIYKSIFENNHENNHKNEYIKIIKDELNIKNILNSNTNEYILNTEIDEELKKEGNIRDLIRELQSLRKDKGLKPEDKININIIYTEEYINEFKINIINTVNAVNISYNSEKNGISQI